MAENSRNFHTVFLKHSVGIQEFFLLFGFYVKSILVIDFTENLSSWKIHDFPHCVYISVANFYVYAQCWIHENPLTLFFSFALNFLLNVSVLSNFTKRVIVRSKLISRNIFVGVIFSFIHIVLRLFSIVGYIAHFALKFREHGSLPKS